MRKYVIDQITLPVFSILMILVGVICFEGIAFLIVALIMLFLSCFLCYRVLLLPLDLICGKQEAEVRFSRQYVLMHYHTDLKRSICIWRFYEDQRKLDLVNPDLTKREDIVDSHTPPKNKTIKIYYYKYSKILCSWEQANQNTLEP